ncbi:hypothetical protein OIV83_003852 [Microbotryomycetes sp. JL201]|nr:hypothetical protein OIV83_003852 [Microbotryomycetes sp. JL201]
MATGAPQRPLIDRRRSSSRERSHVVLGSPPSGPQHHLRSALKHNHVHPDPRDDSQLNNPCWRPPTNFHHAQQPQAAPDSTAATASSSTTSMSRQSSHTGLTQTNNTQSSLSLGQNATAYTRKVGFDTFTSGRDLDDKGQSTGGGTGVNYSFTIGAKSAEFCRTRGTRTYLIATDLNEYSVHALDWAMQNITEDHDELVILRVIDPGSTAHATWKASKDEAREEAEGVLEQVMRKNGEQKQISIVVEFAIGPIEETIHRMIEIYRPDSLVVGTRGKPDSLFKMGPYMGSISKWAVARSPVPVIVVRPSKLVAETLSARASRDVKKRSYVSLLTQQDIDRTKQYGWARNETGGLLLPPGGGAKLEKQTTAPGEDELAERRRMSSEQDLERTETSTSGKLSSSGGPGDGALTSNSKSTPSNDSKSSLKFKLPSLGGSKKKGLKMKKYDTFG